MRTVRATGELLMLGISAVCLWSSQAALGAEKPLRPEVTKLSVCRPVPQGESGGYRSTSMVPESGGGPVPMQDPAVEIHLRLAVPDEFLLKMDVDPERPYTVTDGQDNPLSTADDNNSLGFFAEIAPDGHSCQWVVKAARMPAADTTHLRLQGTLLLTCGAEPKEVTAVVPAKKGQQFQIGLVPVTIADVGKPRIPPMFAPLAEFVQTLAPEQEDFQWGVRLETKHADGFLSIRDLSFHTSDGQPIKTRWSGSGSGSGGMGLGVFAAPVPADTTATDFVPVPVPADTTATDLVPDLTSYMEYEFATEVPEFRYKATSYQELKTIAVPVDIKVGLGL